MFPMNPGGALKSIRAKIAFPASSAVTTVAGCVLVCVNAAATRGSGKIQGTVKIESNPAKPELTIEDRRLKIED
jgi:hypothetical protein